MKRATVKRLAIHQAAGIRMILLILLKNLTARNCIFNIIAAYTSLHGTHNTMIRPSQSTCRA